MKKTIDETHCLLHEKEKTIPPHLLKEDMTVVDKEKDLKPSANDYGNSKVQPVCLIKRYPFQNSLVVVNLLISIKQAERRATLITTTIICRDSLPSMDEIKLGLESEAITNLGVDIPVSAKFAIMHPDNLSFLACRFKTGHVTFVCSNGVVISAMTRGHRKVLALML
jgi:hypothetical protein